MEIQIEPITEHEKAQIKDFLVRHYYPEDQILLATGSTIPSDEEIDYVLDYLDDGVSFKATRDGEICGIVLNCEIDGDIEAEFRRKIHSCENENFKKVLEFYLSWERDTHLWEIIRCREAFSIQVICVKSSHRRKGIMKALVNRSVECAKQRKHTWVTVDCSSFFSAKYFQRADWNCVYAAPYVHFKDKLGKLMFPKANSPHLHVTTFALQI